MENQLLLDYIGKTKTQKLIEEIQSYYFELKQKKFPISKNYVNSASVISVTEDDEIKSIGMSCINDLLLDNFNEFFVGAFLRAGQRELFDIGNASRQVVFRGNPAFTARYNANVTVSCGTIFQIGSGTTPAALDDFNIETAFANGGLEDNRRNTGLGAYTTGVGRINVAGQISPTTGAGSISEFVMYAQWQIFPNQSQTQIFALSRENISPVVNFAALATINTDYVIQI